MTRAITIVHADGCGCLLAFLLPLAALLTASGLTLTWLLLGGTSP